MGLYKKQEKKKQKRLIVDDDDETIIEGESVLKRVKKKAMEASLIDGVEMNKRQFALKEASMMRRRAKRREMKNVAVDKKLSMTGIPSTATTSAPSNDILSNDPKFISECSKLLY
jgi:hypothetical protein